MDKNYIARSIEETRKDFEKTISRHSALMEAWKSVERQSKKDGSDFAILSKNFKNAKLNFDPTYSYGNSLVVSCYIPEYHSYESDSLSTVKSIENGEDTSDRQLIGANGFCSNYLLTVSEIFGRIEERIRYYERKIEEYTVAIEHLDSAFWKFANAIDSALQETKKFDPIYYSCVQWMHKQF